MHATVRSRAVHIGADDPTFEALVAEELAAGNVDAAFRLADRHCRSSGRPEPYRFVLRAEVLHRMGRQDLAFVDLGRALALAPDDLLANRRMLSWSRGPEQRDAAIRLAQQDCDGEVHRQCIDVLRRNGRNAIAHIRVLHTIIEGWVFWAGHGRIVATLVDDHARQTYPLDSDPSHALRHGGSAASFRIARDGADRVRTFDVANLGSVFSSTRIAPSLAPQPRRLAPPRPARRGAAGVIIVVPVHSDYPATRACLQSLSAALQETPHHRVVLVNDASPDPKITDLLAAVADPGRIDVITNDRNLGFVGSINRALNGVADHDVILLNADTMVMPGFVDRLEAAAYSAPDIGTVTPLSNNGEFTSFPTPNRSNPMPSRLQIERLDRAAVLANARSVIDIPSGIGFCLYITQACLAATGLLSEDYHRGYLEDADFCLRARDLGFRNVCAASVFVGHSGSRSFALEKRALVVRNLDVLERRFPAHRSECSAFMAADPLRVARANLERLLPAPAAHPRLLVAPAGPLCEIAAERARRWVRKAQDTIVLSIERHCGGDRIKLRNASGGVPQSIDYDLGSTEDRGSLATYLVGLGASGVELFDLVGTPDRLLEMLARLPCPVDLVVADPGLLSFTRGRSRSAVPARWPADAATDGRGDLPIPSPIQEAVLRTARRIYAPSLDAQAVAARLPAALVPAGRIVPIDAALSQARQVLCPKEHAGTCRLGLVPFAVSPTGERTIADLVRHLQRLRPTIPILVLGSLKDQRRIAALSNVSISGEIDPSEFGPMVVTHGVTRLMMALDRPLFGHPTVALVRRCALPTAYVDWSLGQVAAPDGDLALDPLSSLEAAALALADWLPR